MVTSYIKQLTLLLALSAIASQDAYSQYPLPYTRDDSHLVEQVLEVLEDLDEENPEELLELLLSLLENPIDLNEATADDLLQLPFLEPISAGTIILFRERFGPFNATTDILAIDGIAVETYMLIAPFITVQAGEHDPFQPNFRPHRAGRRFDIIHRVARRIDLGRGYSQDSSLTIYRGSPVRAYTRLSGQYRRLAVNLTLNKNPGETFEWNPSDHTFGYTFQTFHVALHRTGIVHSVIAGDYIVETGQGLMLWRSTGFGKGSQTTRGPIRRAGNVVPYRSTGSGRFLRGIAASLDPGRNLAMSLFFSRRHIDATVQNAGTDSAYVTSITPTGLYRTSSELARKRALEETVYGAALSYATSRVSIGLAGFSSQFGTPLAAGTQSYRLHDFTGKVHRMGSVHGHATLGPTYWFGEIAGDSPGSIGMAGGTLWNFAAGSDAIIVARYYPPEFTSLYGHGFGDRSGATRNEYGIYTGMRVRVHSHWRLNVFFDQFCFPWLRFGVPRPTSGHDKFISVEYRPHAQTNVRVQLRDRTREEAKDVLNERGMAVRGTSLARQMAGRIQVEYHLDESLRFRTRIDVTGFRTSAADGESGYLLLQDVRWRPLTRVQIDSRLASFNTAGFDTRIFAYEYDLPLVFAAPALFGSGWRSYLLVRYRFSESLEIHGKLAKTRWNGVDSVGSGLDETPGNRIRDVSAQVRWRF